jgi:hypothetical protein
MEVVVDQQINIQRSVCQVINCSDTATQGRTHLTMPVGGEPVVVGDQPAWFRQVFTVQRGNGVFGILRLGGTQPLRVSGLVMEIWVRACDCNGGQGRAAEACAADECAHGDVRLSGHEVASRTQKTKRLSQGQAALYMAHPDGRGRIAAEHSKGRWRAH